MPSVAIAGLPWGGRGLRVGIAGASVAYACGMKSWLRVAALSLAAGVGMVACGDPVGRADAPTSAGPDLTDAPTAEVPSPTPPAPAGQAGDYEGDFNVPVPEASPAPPDEYGEWYTLVMQGIQTDIPVGPDWRVQVQGDPCYGDARYRYLLEDKLTGDRIKVDVVEHRVTVASTEPSRLDGIVARIRRSFHGEQVPYPFLERHGPSPTSPACESEGDTVPTLTPDSFVPGGAASETPTPAA